MSPTPLRIPCLAAASLVILAACQAPDRLAPVDPPAPPPPNVAPYAFYLNIDVVNGTVQVVPPGPPKRDGAAGPELSLMGAEAIGMATSNFFRSTIGQFVANKRTITFDLTLSNKLSVTDLVTPTFPIPPNGLQGILAFPYTIAAYGVQGGKATPNTDWNGDGSAGSGKPINFFNDFGTCGTAITSDCYRWELFPTPLTPGHSTPAQKVGFTVDKNVTNVGVYVVVAADLVDHPPPPSQPGLGALMGTVTSQGGGPLAGVTITLTPGSKTATTDGVGKYLLTGVPVGSYSATVSGVPAGCTAPASTSVAIASGGVTTADFSVSCQPTTGSIGGTAASPELGPFNGATVQLLQASIVAQTSTDAAGGFSFTGVAPGNYVVQVIGLAAPCPATSGQVGVTVTAGNTSPAAISVSCPTTATGTIMGSVTSPQLGPLAAKVTVVSNGQTATASTDQSSGAYGPLTVPAGSATVTVSGLPAGCTTPASSNVTVSSGASTTLDITVVCQASPNILVQGTVSSPTLGTLDGVTLQVQTLDGIFSTQTSGGGNFQFDASICSTFLCQNATTYLAFTIVGGLPAPCITPNSIPVPYPSTPPALVPITVDCSGGGTGSVTVFVVSNTFQLPLTGVLVELADPSGPLFQGTTDANGELQHTLGIGSFTASLLGLPAACTPPPAAFQTTPNTDVSVTIVLTCSPYLTPVIIGQVVTAQTASALTGVSVTVKNGSQQLFVTQTDGVGAFNFDRSICAFFSCGDQFVVSITGGLPAACTAPADIQVTGNSPGFIVPIKFVVDCP